MNNLVYRVIKKNNICSRDGGFIKSSCDIININGWFNLDHEYNNIGDLLSYVIVKEVADKYYGIDIEKDNTKRKKEHLYSVGSTLLGWQDQTIWGSGFLHDITKLGGFPIYKAMHRCLHKTDVRAVRGPLSKTVIEKVTGGGYMP